jgi:hypothetical protein
VADRPDPESLSIDRLAGDPTEQRRAEPLLLDLSTSNVIAGWTVRGVGRCQAAAGWKSTAGPTTPNALLLEAWAYQG